MSSGAFFDRHMETLPRDELDSLVDERIRYTVEYANEHSPFYRKWFREHHIRPQDVRCHDDLAQLPVISGKTIRENQPPLTDTFLFRSVPWEEIFTVHETSGTSGTPKSFFLTWDDWERYAAKYARIFVSQGFGKGDRVVICASYGMNVGANTMTLAARGIGMTIIPTGKCTFPHRILESYRPTGIVGSVFKLLRLARQLSAEGQDPRDTSLERLIVGGESFAEESRAYLAEVWDREVFNTYGSTEGTMCGECSERSGLHVPEDLVHLDVYDPAMGGFVPDGECGRAVLTTLIPHEGRCGTLLINYDTEDTTVVLTRSPCACGRTHMKIYTPQREAETLWILGIPVNRVDIERGVFQPEHMEYLTGEYEAFVYPEKDGGVTLQVNMEALNPGDLPREDIGERFLASFLRIKPGLAPELSKDFQIHFHFTTPGGLELSRVKGRPKRLVDRR
ncbi:MAG: coenzyme F390 synthetase [Methanolinea sp.]|nr:coenzyme F390 synthetase [Methanolinea sp.]